MNFSVLNKNLFYLVSGLLLGSLIGCQKPVVEVQEPVFFPPAPEQPRLQFLKAITGPQDLGDKGPSGFDAFLFGEPKETEFIKKPFGLDLYQGKIYVCDIGAAQIKILDLENKTVSNMPLDRRMLSPVSIFIEPNGTKYIADSQLKAIAVYSASDKLISILGEKLDIIPRDVYTHDRYLYVTDSNNNQVVIMDKVSGELVGKIGREAEGDEESPGTFLLISSLALDRQGNVYVTDKITATIARFDASGEVTQSYGSLGSRPSNLVRAKGIAIDREDRIWVVDAGPAQAVKIYRNDGQFLMHFGTRGTRQGRMYMPAMINIDYDHIKYFQKYAAEGVKLEFLVFVTNQFGPNKVSVYGFGDFSNRAQVETPLKNSGASEATPEPTVE